MSEKSLNSLPDEVLIVVFSHLPVEDRLSACLVCKHWLELINYRRLLKDVNVKIKMQWAVNHFLPMTRNFVNFTFINILLEHKMIELFIQINPFVEFICFEDCAISSEMDMKTFHTLIPSLENLTELKVIGCTSWINFTLFPSLKKLSIVGNYDVLTDSELALLQKTMKHLESFKLHGNVVHKPVVYNRFYPSGYSYEKRPSSQILSFPGIKSFIAERAGSLYELDIKFRDLTPSVLKEISAIKGLKLKKLAVDNLGDGHKSLIEVFKNQPNLKELYLSFSILDENTIFALCSLLPNIEELSLDGKITDYSFIQLFQLHNLKKLHIFANTNISSDAFNDAVCNFKPFQLKHLNLSYISIPGDSCMFFKQLVHLNYLNLTHSMIEDCHVHVISAYLTNLKELNLSYNQITDKALTGIPRQNNDSVKPIHNLRCLTKLDLSHCVKLTAVGLTGGIRFPLLRSLCLVGFFHDFDGAFRQLFCQNKSLAKIFWGNGTWIAPNFCLAWGNFPELYISCGHKTPTGNQTTQ